MEDCLHTSSENLSKLVSWAHSHGTICSLIPNLKHLLTEGAHGNLTAMWGCSAGHAYHWPLTATCKTGPKDRVCYQDSRSMGSDSLSLQAPGIPGDRFLARASKGKGPDCGQTRDSCDFSNCSEPSEVDDNTEDYNSNLFDIVCESSATDEDGDYELQNAPRTAPRKRGVPGAAQGDQWRQRTDETPGDPAVKKIKQEVPEDYYTVANAQAPGGMDLGPMSPSPKQAAHRLPPLQTALVNKPSPVEGSDLPAPSPSPSGKSTPSMAKPHRAPLPVAQGGPQLPGHSELADPMSGDGLGKPGGAPLPLRDTDDSPAGVSSDLEIVPAQTLGSDPKAEGSVPPAVLEIERLKGLLQAERSRSESMGETINGLKQDKELLQQELTKKAELICEFLQEQLTTRPEKRRAQSYNQPEASGSRQRVPMYSDESTTFESPALFDSFDEIEMNPNERAKMVKIPKRNREGENTRVRMKNVVGVIARYMTALQEFRRSVSMKVAFDRVGVDRNTISRTAAIAELSLAAPEVFHSLPPWDEKEETLAHYSFRCRQAMDDTIKAKIKAMKAKGELLPIVSK